VNRLYAKYDHVPDDKLEEYLFEEMRFERSPVKTRDYKTTVKTRDYKTKNEALGFIVEVMGFVLIFLPTFLSWLSFVDESSTPDERTGAVLFGLFITFPAWTIVSASAIGLVYLFYPEFLLNFDIMDENMIKNRIKTKRGNWL
jgi:uncharacterized membrane protein